MTTARPSATPRFIALLASVLIVLIGVTPAAAKPPRARAVEFEEKIIFRSPENPGFAAWAQLWPEPANASGEDLGAKLLLRRKPAAGEHVDHPPIDVHRWEAVGLPVKYDFADLVNEAVYLRSRDGGATWAETLRCPEPELNQVADSGCMSPIALPDGRMLSLSWGMPGCLRESSDGGRTWRRLHELMDPAFYDVAPFTIRLLSDRKTLVIFCPYARSWGPGKLVGGRLHSRPGSRAAWQAGLFFSTDFGQTLTGPIPIFPNVPVTEADFCELPGGDLLFLQNEMFAGGVAHRQLVRKTKSAWVPEEMEEVGKLAPEIFVRTNEGYLVGARRNAAYVWSEDDGVTWQVVEDIKSGEYQPRALLLKDNRILFLWHKGGDLPYGQADMYIGQHMFKLQVVEPRLRSRLKLERTFDEAARKYICAFEATLTTTEGKPIADKPIQFSIVARGAPGYEPFGGATPWVHGAKQMIKTDAHGVARLSYPEQSAITDIHQTFQVAARFDPERQDPQCLPATSLTIEYYAVTPTGQPK